MLRFYHLVCVQMDAVKDSSESRRTDLILQDLLLACLEVFLEQSALFLEEQAVYARR